jgi:hypothetical protein
MERERAAVHEDLTKIVGLAAEKVTLSSVNYGGSSVTVSGAAPNVGLIYRYARDLRESGRFSEVWIKSITGSEGGFSFAFSLTK